MKKHQIKQRLDDLAQSDIIRVVPESYVIKVPRKSAEDCLSVLKTFIEMLSNKYDVFERMPFYILEDDPDSDPATIRGRYAFSDVTIVDKPKIHKIDMAYHEIAFGGPCVDLNGRYCAIELESIARKLLEKRDD